MRILAENADDALLAHLAAEHAALVDRVEQLMHSSVIGTMYNTLINISYRQIMNHLRLLRLNRKLSRQIILRALREHGQIIEACQRRDAEAALQAHLQAAVQRNIGFL